jgi:hypothetical protein
MLPLASNLFAMSTCEYWSRSPSMSKCPWIPCSNIIIMVIYSIKCALTTKSLRNSGFKTDTLAFFNTGTLDPIQVTNIYFGRRLTVLSVGGKNYINKYYQRRRLGYLYCQLQLLKMLQIELCRLRDAINC